jgi:hypothetical protein
MAERRADPGSILMGVSVGVLIWVLVWHLGFARTTLGQHALNPFWPSRAQEQSAHPIGTPAPVPAPDSSYRFARGEGAAPAGFNPCRPVHYVMRTAGMPAGGQRIVDNAMSRLSQVTGLEMIYDGPTQEAPRSGRPSVLKDLYGDRWAPVLITWSDPVEFPALAGDVAGLGGGVSVDVGNHAVTVTGSLALDGPQLAGMLELHDGGKLVRAVLLHELGHVVGLGHVDDRTQLMSPDLSPSVTDYAAGDLTGLAILGSGPCTPGV